MTKTTPTALVVLHAFGKYGRGDLITDSTVIQAILNGGNSSLVVIPALPVSPPDETTTSGH